jgi:hypothetical protein
MKVKFEIGDWSKDGHNQFDTFILEVDGSVDVEKDYVKGMRKVGFDLTEYCQEYEDHCIPKALVHKIWELGYETSLESLQPDYDDEPGSDECWIGSEDYLDLYMTIAMIGNGNIKYSTVGDDISVIRPGGYGLFCN